MNLLLDNINLKGGLIYPSNYGFRVDIPFKEQTWLHTEDILQIRYMEGVKERYIIDLGWYCGSNFEKGFFQVMIDEISENEEIIQMIYRRFATDMNKLIHIITNCIEVIEESRDILNER
jgi:hypothetical protein